MAIGLRIGIFTSVFGASLKRAIPISFIQPMIIFILISFLYFNHIFFTNFSVYLIWGNNFNNRNPMGNNNRQNRKTQFCECI